MKAYTPINEHKLSKKGQEFLKEAKRLKNFSIKHIHVPSEVFRDILDSMSPNERFFYSDSGEIPFEGKLLVRR